MRRALLVLSLVAVTVVASAREVNAQRRGYGGWSGSGGYYPQSRYDNSYYGSRAYSPSYYPSSDYTYTNQAPIYFGAVPTTDSYQSFYSGPSADSTTAMISLQVPPGAEVWFGDSATEQRGPSRSFVSPPLDPSKTYSYDVRVRWMQNGQPEEQTRRVQVRAGDRLRVDFMTAGSTSATPAGATNTTRQPAFRTDRSETGVTGGVIQPNAINSSGPLTPARANTTNTVIDGVIVPVRPSQNPNPRVNVNPTDQLPAGVANPNVLPAGQANPNQLPAGEVSPNQLPAGQADPNRPSPSIVPGNPNPNQLPPGIADPNTPSPSIVPSRK